MVSVHLIHATSVDNQSYWFIKSLYASVKCYAYVKFYSVTVLVLVLVLMVVGLVLVLKIYFWSRSRSRYRHILVSLTSLDAIPLILKVEKFEIYVL